MLRSRVHDGRLYAVYGSEGMRHSTSSPARAAKMFLPLSVLAAEYGLPMDEKELDRIDLCHAKYYALLDKRRFLAPIPPHPQAVLDLGCGTGAWSQIETRRGLLRLALCTTQRPQR